MTSDNVYPDGQKARLRLASWRRRETAALRELRVKLDQVERNRSCPGHSGDRSLVMCLRCGTTGPVRVRAVEEVGEAWWSYTVALERVSFWLEELAEL